MKNELKFCKDIGLFTINRSLEKCVHATQFCKSNCYCKKFESMYAYCKDNLEEREEAYWAQLTGESLKADMATKRKHTHRIRLMSRGEAIGSKKDIVKIKDLCDKNPDVLFMLPTRAWRSHRMLDYMLEIFGDGVPNLRLLFSTDPHSFADCLTMMGRRMPHPLLARMSITFFGADNDFPWGDEAWRCPKTWDRKSGITCLNCYRGCFIEDPTALKIIHFKQH